MNRGKLGFGMYKITDENKLDSALRKALEVGYKHIDTASYYKNEELIGRVLKDYNRENITVTTKIWTDDMSENKIEKAFYTSLEKLGKIDIVLLHWPHPEHYVSAYKFLTKLYNEKIVKKIGVSNFEICHLDKLLDNSDIIPYINQIELHPKLPQNKIVEYNESKGIITEAWSPIAKATYLDNNILKEIAKKYNATSSQIILAWEIKRGIFPIPKSENLSRIEENFNSQFIKLREEDIKKIDKMNEGRRVGIHPLDFPY